MMQASHRYLANTCVTWLHCMMTLCAACGNRARITRCRLLHENPHAYNGNVDQKQPISLFPTSCVRKRYNRGLETSRTIISRGIIRINLSGIGPIRMTYNPFSYHFRFSSKRGADVTKVEIDFNAYLQSRKRRMKTFPSRHLSRITLEYLFYTS